MQPLHFDVVIVGGGPAGLSAALVLARCCRRVLLCDEGKPRNAASQALHGFITRDGTPPQELLRLAREELCRYDVDWRQERVRDAGLVEGGFEVFTDTGACFRARKLLLTTGVVDVLPNVPGFAELYGRGVYHCPYCDGWEVRGQTLVAYGSGKAGTGLAETLRGWSRHVVLCLDGGAPPEADEMERLTKLGISVRAGRITRLDEEGGRLVRVVLLDGEPIECAALFFSTGQHQRSTLAERLGCEFDSKGSAVTDHREQSNVPGLYLAGDASQDVQFIVVAAAEGAKAAVAINTELREEDFA